MFFSWPSEAYRRQFLGFDYYSKNAYLETRQIALKSHKYVALAIDELEKQHQPLDIVAHSMGADIAVKALLLRKTKLTSLADSPLFRKLSLVLAAPDISADEFAIDMLPVLAGSAQSVTIIAIYCADDLALSISRMYNNSDRRLGYCTASDPPADISQMITIRGDIPGLSHHSYYLNSPKVLEDMKKRFAPIVPAGMRRVIVLH